MPKSKGETSSPMIQRIDQTSLIRTPLTSMLRPIHTLRSLQLGNTQRPFSVIYVPKDSPEPTIFVLIYGLIRTKGHLSVLFVAKHSLVNMIARDMKTYIIMERNLSAEAILLQVGTGAVAEVSQERTPWQDTIVRKPVGFVYNLYTT